MDSYLCPSSKPRTLIRPTSSHHSRFPFPFPSLMPSAFPIPNARITSTTVDGHPHDYTSESLYS